MGVSGQRHAPAALYPWVIHWIGGWVALRAEEMKWKYKKMQQNQDFNERHCVGCLM
jgi:hypothetical protein